MATVTVDYFGVSGTGRTVKDAKLDAGRKIQQAMKEGPQAYKQGALTLFVWPTAEGASYTIVGPSHKDGRVWNSATCIDMDDAKLSGIKHLLSYDRAVGDNAMPEWAVAMLGAAECRNILADWQRNDRFQAAYKEAISQGKTDTEAHEYACNAR